MAIINFTGFETGNNADEHSALTVTGAFTGIGTSSKKNGAYGLQMDVGAGGAGTFALGVPSAVTLQEADFSEANLYITFNFRPVTLPSAGTFTDVCYLLDTVGTKMGYLSIGSGGVLRWLDTSETLVQTGSTALATGTWYEIDIKSIKGSPGSYEVRINGSVELSGSYTAGTNNHARLLLGTFHLATAAVEYWYDDVVMDNAAYFSGTPCVLRIGPTGAGASHDFTGGTGTSTYLEEDEIPADTTTYTQCPTGGNKRELVTLQSCATVGITKAPAAVKVWVKVRENTTVTSSNKITFRTGATNYDSAGVNLTTTISNRYQIRTTNPNTTVGWTTADIDALQVGVLETNSVAVRISVIHAFVLFDSTVNVASGYSSTKNLASLGCGN